MLWSTWNAGIIDSGCFVLKGLLDIRKKKVYVSALIKHRRYWPSHVYGDAINDYFRSIDIGDVVFLSG